MKQCGAEKYFCRPNTNISRLKMIEGVRVREWLHSLKPFFVLHATFFHSVSDESSETDRNRLCLYLFMILTLTHSQDNFKKKVYSVGCCFEESKKNYIDDREEVFTEKNFEFSFDNHT
jgi:hypothetical protein